jgi:diguanylate cyclase (GGDEF)-like protein
VDDVLSQLLVEAYAPPALLLDASGRVSALSQAARRLLESWSMSREPLGAAPRELLPPELAHDVLALRRRVADAPSVRGPVRVLGVTALQTVVRVATEGAVVVSFERVSFESAAGATPGLTVGEPGLLVTRDGRIAALNAAAERLLDTHGIGTPGASLVASFEPAFLRLEWPRMLRELVRTQATAGEVRLSRAGDGAAPLWASLRAVLGPAGQVACVSVVIPELDPEGAAGGLSRRAFYDALTGLPNRRLFREHVKMALRRAERHQAGLGVLLVDLDRVRAVNDTLGRELGDELLREAAQRLSRELRAADVLARVGGDDFAVVLDDVATGEDATRVCHKLIAALTRPFRLQGHEVFCGASLGVALYPDAGKSEGALLESAQAALTQARGAGRNKYVILPGE